MTNSIKKAEQLGRQAFHDGKTPAPVHNKEIMEMIKPYDLGDKKSLDIMKTYTRAWTDENLKQPI